MSTSSQEQGQFRTSLSNSSLNANSFEIILLTGSIKKGIKGPVSLNKGITKWIQMFVTAEELSIRLGQTAMGTRKT